MTQQTSRLSIVVDATNAQQRLAQFRQSLRQTSDSSTARFKIDGKPTDNPELDKCGGRLSDCKLRDNEQRFGGFPASSLIG